MLAKGRMFDMPALHCCTILTNFFLFFSDRFLKKSLVSNLTQTRPLARTDGRQARHIEANRTLPRTLRTRFHRLLSSFVFYMQYNAILFFVSASPTVTLIVSQCRDMYMILTTIGPMVLLNSPLQDSIRRSHYMQPRCGSWVLVG